MAVFGAAAAWAQRHFAAETAHMLTFRNRLESGLKAISPNKSSPAKFLPLGEGLQMHYVEAQYRRLKGCIGERFHGRSNGSNGQHWGDRQRTNPSQNIATTD